MARNRTAKKWEKKCLDGAAHFLAPRELSPLAIPTPPPQRREKLWKWTSQRKWLAKTTLGFACRACAEIWEDKKVAAAIASAICPKCRRRAKRVRTPAINAKRAADRLRQRLSAIRQRPV